MNVDNKVETLTLELAKHLVTIALAATGFVLTIMFTSVGDETLGKATLFKTSLALSLVLFVLCVLFAVLTQAAVLTVAEGARSKFLPIKPKICLFLAWSCLVFAVVELVVFSWANTFGGVPLGL